MRKQETLSGQPAQPAISIGASIEHDDRDDANLRQGSNLEGLFEFQLSTDRVKTFKPDPAAYSMATEAFDLGKHQIAFVAFGGWDVAGAKAFGYPTYWVNRLNVSPEELGVSADRTGHDLSSLPMFIDFSPRT